MLKIVKIFNRLRLLYFGDSMSMFIISSKYKIRTYLGLIRGFYSLLLGRIIYESNYRPIIIGSRVDFDMRCGSSIILSGKNTDLKIVDPANQLIPTASSIGVYPHYEHINISMAHPTRIRLKRNAKLVLEPNTTILTGCYLAVAADKELKIGAESYIAHGVVINTTCGLDIGKNVMIGHQSTIMDYDGHPVYVNGDEFENRQSYGGMSSKIIIEDNVWIGFKSTILKGVKIGEGAIVGANSCVTSDVPAHSIVAGNPARVVKEGVRWERY